MQRTIVKIFGVTIIGSLLLAGVASATGYYSNDMSLQNGMLVSAASNGGFIESADSATAAKLIGVAAPQTVSLDDQTGKTNVVTDGEVSALVSTLNGPIKVGDRIAPSALRGIGEKATANGWIVGIAQSGFDTTSSNSVKTAVTDAKGVKRQTYVGQISVVVHPQYYGSVGIAGNRVSNNSLQSIADKLAGKQASELAILLSFILLFVGLLVVGLSVNSIIKGGLLAMSRQPLIRGSLLKAITQSFGIVLLVLAAVFAAALFMLRAL